MRAALAFVLAALLVATAAGAGLKTVFEIPLKYPVTTFQEGQETSGAPASMIGGDRIYSITSGQMGIEAADLKTQSYLWAANASMTLGGVAAVVGTTGGAIALGNGGIEAFDANGNKLMTTSKYSFQGGVPKYVLNGTSIGVLVLNTMLFETALVVVDLTNGKITEDVQVVSVNQIGGTAYVTYGGMTHNHLIAVDIATNTTLWTVDFGSAGAAASVLAASDKYVFATRGTANGDTLGLILDPATGATIRTLDALNGVNADCAPAKLKGDILTLIIGAEFQRLVIYNLTNGYQIFTRTVGESGGGCGGGGGSAVVTSSGIVTMNNNNLELTITSLTTGSSITVKQVPSNPSGSVTAFAGDIVAVGNLQGYTLWDTKDGSYVGRNEKSPSAGASAPLMYGKYYVSVAGNMVVVQEFTQ